MWNEPTIQQLSRLPRLYATEQIPADHKIIHEHFFLGGCDWYVAEFDPEQRLFFGFAILGGDLDNAEWGYIRFNELRELRTREGFEVDRDLYWKPRKASEVDKIADTCGYSSTDGPERLQ